MPLNRLVFLISGKSHWRLFALFSIGEVGNSLDAKYAFPTSTTSSQMFLQFWWIKIFSICLLVTRNEFIFEQVKRRFRNMKLSLGRTDWVQWSTGYTFSTTTVLYAYWKILHRTSGIIWRKEPILRYQPNHLLIPVASNSSATGTEVDTCDSHVFGHWCLTHTRTALSQ